MGSFPGHKRSNQHFGALCAATAALALVLGSCAAGPPQAPGEPTSGSEEPVSPIAGKKLVAQFIATATPGVPGWRFEQLPLGADEHTNGVTKRTMAATGFGDEAEAVAIGTQVGLANCSAGSCGGKCAAGQEVPSWYTGFCLPNEAVAQGKVSITNLTADKFLVEPVAVFSQLSPSSLEFFSAFPAPFTFTCSSFLQTRSADPLNGAYYVRYADIGPSGCDDGLDFWITAPTEVAEANAAQSFQIAIYAESLNPIQVPNGGFENGLTDWTVNSGAGVAAIAEHCSHSADFSCGASEDGVLAPVGSSMARLTTIDGGATPAYAAYMQSSQIVLQAESSLTFRSKLGTREPANFCSATRDDTWYVEARKNGGSWVQLALPNPPDDDGDGTVEAIDDCSDFDEIGLSAVFEQAWNPGSALSPQDFQSITTDLAAAPLSAVGGDTIEFRFWVVGGTPAQLDASVFLLDDVSVVAN